MAKFCLVKSAVLAALITLPTTLWACEAAGPSTHVGNITAINAASKSFTIRDAETKSLITFTANSEIMGNIKDAKGSVMVNYEETDDGMLSAVGVTF